ncbi:MAG: BLUF domain-containing protein [Rubricella sp.]
MASGLYSLIYRSYARPPWMGERTMAEIARESNAFNLTHNITGLLIFDDGVFVQVLEGPTVEILQLTARIAADRRNERLRVLWHGNIDKRRFPEWAMGCFDMTELPEGATPVASAITTRGSDLPVWTQSMTQDLIDFYRENRVSGLDPVFNRMRRIV